jgi:signal transduction histidine kinase/TolB-like protein/CheY-like chemotaxis protein
VKWLGDLLEADFTKPLSGLREPGALDCMGAVASGGRNTAGEPGPYKALCQTRAGPLDLGEARTLGETCTWAPQMQADSATRLGSAFKVNDPASATAADDSHAEGPQQPEQPRQALHQTQKMESLARLTGGLAHDFNNLLTVVIGNATALRLDAEGRGDAKGIRRAETIERAAERGGRLAGQLLAFSRNQVLRPESLSAYGALSAMYDLLGQAAGEIVRIRLLADKGLWNCRVDLGQLDSAVLNLVLNARDAMPTGGNITISCHNQTMDFGQAQDSTRSSGDYVRIDVKDTGTGIPSDLLDSVFEPFFTTKPIGKGSGLGLAQVHGFAGQSGGWVVLESHLGRGTTVSLYLPRASDAEVDPLVQAAWPAPTGSELTVLVVESDAEVRTTICEILTLAGYHALAATNASGAVAYLVSDEPVHVLFTEARLPGGVSGSTLARDARRMRPHLCALLTSSSADDAAHESHDDGKSFEFLMKPYQASDVVRVVGALLKGDSFSTETEQLLAEVSDVAPLMPPLNAPHPGEGLSDADRPASSKHMQSAGARRNAIRLGVMPFKTTGSTGETGLSLGLAEEVSGAFARFHWITCVAPASVATVANEPLGRTSRWQQLDLDFLVEGTLRKRGNEIRIQARLLNMRGSGEIIWARRFDSTMSDVLNMQDDIASATAAQVAPELLVWEGEKAASRPQVDPSAYDLMLRAIPAIYCLDHSGFQAAGTLLERSLELDPSSAACHSWLAHWYLLLIGQGWATDATAAIRHADQLAQRAVVLDPRDARGFTVAGHVRAFLYKESEEALWLHERAIALNPNLALAWCYSGLAHSYLGQHTDAIRHIQRARRLSPHDPHGFFFDMALVMPFLLTGDYEIAAQLARRARAAHPGLSSTYKGLLAALGKLGLASEAATLREQLFGLEPQFSVQEAIIRSPLLRQEDLDRYAEGLRLAGIPERFVPAS